MVNCNRPRWIGHVARRGGTRITYGMLTVKSLCKRPRKTGWEVNIKMDLTVTQYSQRLILIFLDTAVLKVLYSWPVQELFQHTTYNTKKEALPFINVRCLPVARYLRASLTVTVTHVGSQPAEVHAWEGRGSDCA
jgi:hypothetical protein